MDRLLDRDWIARRFAALLWSAFIGGVCSLAVLLTLPLSWFEPGAGIGALSLLFFLLWALALVPAAAAALLADRRPGERP
jgi:hypothetical protein